MFAWLPISKSMSITLTCKKHTFGAETTSYFFFLHRDQPLFMLELPNKIQDTQLIERPIFLFVKSGNPNLYTK